MLRYIPLPDKGDISVILTPQDQGDFDYRYYLLTIKHNKIVSGIYVEGEWYEPGSNEIEKTQFSIDKNYLITVVSIYEGEETVANYKIKDSGKLEETEN